MLTEEKKKKLIQMFEQNGELWARQKIRGKKFNAEKREFLKFLLEKQELETARKERNIETEKHEKSLREQRSSTNASWAIAIGTIALVIVTGIVALITYYH